jgi:hypothetical protein
MRRLSLLILAVLSIAFIVLLVPFIGNPDLYTLYNESYTEYHSNPATLWEYSYERSDALQEMMQELLDAPHPIVLNIKIRDFEEAKREFEDYKEKSRYFNEVVVNLDLTDSALDDFRKENRKNMEALERIINESARFEEINRLEIQYRSEENPALLYTVAYEGEAIHSALQKTNAQLREREPDILELSSKFELNTSQYQEAVDILAEILEEDRIRQQERELNRPQLSRSSLSLSVTPRTGRYGDTLRVDGAYTFLKVQEVTLVLDSRDWKILQPDANGGFSTPLPIGRIRGGDHVIFATTGSLNSNLVTFTVVPTDTELTLATYQGDRWDEVFFDGELHAGALPVRSAPVRILVDDFESLTFATDQDGYYYGSLNLTRGNHTLQAVFDDPAYPLNPSESGVKTLTLAPSVPILLAVGAGAGAGLLAFLGLAWYIRRKNSVPAATTRERSAPDRDGSIPLVAPVSAPDSRPESPALRSPVTILLFYQDLFNAGEWSAAAALLYGSLTERLTPLPGVSDPTPLTPREFASRLSPSSPKKQFREFIRRYEEVRYGGMPLRQQDLLLTHWNSVLAGIESAEEGSHG